MALSAIDINGTRSDGQVGKEIGSAHGGTQEKLYNIDFGVTNNTEVPLIDATPGSSGEDGVLDPRDYRSITIIHRNGEGGGGEVLTMKVYGSNYPVKQTTLANIQLYSVELTGGGVAVNPATNIDICESMTAATGVNFEELISAYRFIYITATSGVGATAAQNQHTEILMKS